MFIVILTYKRPFAEIEPHLAAHCAFLERHYADGSFLCSGPQHPRTGGVIMCRAENRAEVEAWIAEDPFRREDLAAYEIIDFRPTRTAEGLEELAG